MIVIWMMEFELLGIAETVSSRKNPFPVIQNYSSATIP